MKTETLIYNELTTVIPENTVKTVMFAKIAVTNYEMFFYSFFGNNEQPKQCFHMSEDGQIDGNDLDNVFAKIAILYKQSNRFQSDKNNILTIIVEGTKVYLKVEYYDRDIKLNNIKKAWKEKNL